ncbi:MAG: AgmX/PglI C-terminal domain-containing protein [Polyangiales bacterium]|nr:AgmX/PglI C-terminal domain-containing protein [Myxococcales bacterium]MCB9657970.1 AgmX/PglI C-terminal domain-containing protein [Sandaracinaceae bacterium]
MALCCAALLATGCAGGGSPPETTPRETTADRAERPRTDDHDAPTETPEPSPRQLSAAATFADLVAAVRALDGLAQSESAAGCLLRGGELAPFVLEADLASAVHPIPDAPAELGSRLDDPRETAVVLTRWAQHGASSGLALVGLNTTPPPAAGHLAVVVLAREGAHLRRTDTGVAPRHAGPFPVDRLHEHLPVVAEGAAAVVVTAEGRVPLSTLRLALGQVPGSATVVLAVALEAGVRLPSPPAADPSTHGLCAAGALPPPPADQRLGTLGADAIRARLDSMSEGAMRCFEFARGDAARGGRIRVLTRIGPQGRVTEACAATDELGDPTLRTCVLSVVRGVVFPAPTEGDFVDVALPIRLRPDTSTLQRPLCDG